MKEVDLSKVRRKMGFLFQDAALFDSLTLYENLALPLQRLSKKTQEEIDSIVDRVLGRWDWVTIRRRCPRRFQEGCASALD